jgi:hypothetical protein
MLPRNLFRLANVAVSSTTPAVAVHALSALNAALFSSSTAIYQAKPASAAAKKPAGGKKPSEGDPMSPKSLGPVSVKPADLPSDKAAVYRKDPAHKAAVKAAGGDPAETKWLKDENIQEAYRNLLMLADHKPDAPPRASALHRVLRQIKTKEDVPIAVKALNMALTKGIQIDLRSATTFAKNCAAVGDIDTPMERFKNPSKYRMFLTSSACTALLKAAGEMKDLEKLKKLLAVIRVAQAHEPGQNRASANRRFRLGFDTMRAFASCGDFASALAVWDSLMIESPKSMEVLAFPHASLLKRLVDPDVDAAAASLGKLDAPSMAILTDKLLPVSKKFAAARAEEGTMKSDFPELVKKVCVGACKRAAPCDREGRASVLVMYFILFLSFSFVAG